MKFRRFFACFFSLCMLCGCADGSEPVSAAAGRADIAVTAASWGLSFPKNGETPIGNATSAQLAKYNARYVGDTSKKVIYLTFDCGYENGYTNQILDVLSRRRIPAAFFVVGAMVESAPELILRMADEGHIIGNHTCNHPNMSAIRDPGAFRTELEELKSRVEQVTGREMPLYYRPPQGIYSEENLKNAHALGYQTILWSLAYVDWYNDDQPTDQEAYDKLLPRIHNGAIVLLHQTSATNARILDDLLTRWEEMGYSFASLDDLPPLDSGTPEA